MKIPSITGYISVLVLLGTVAVATKSSGGQKGNQNVATSDGGEISPVAADELSSPASASSQHSRREDEACSQPLPDSDCTSESQPEPLIGRATPGVRVRMPAYGGMEWQLFLPQDWEESGSKTYPVVVFLHGAGDGVFSVMNSQSLPRLLARNQSTCFDSRTCWCLEPEYARARAKKEAPATSPEPFLEDEEDLNSPMADCDFAETFGAIVVMPQGWLPDFATGWTRAKLLQVESMTRHVLETWRGDPERVTLTGQSAGGAGAWRFASLRPKLWAAVNVICAPGPPTLAHQLEGVKLWVVGWTGDGEMGNDDIVAALKQRSAGSVRYTRYTKAPGPPDPQYRHMLGHASYDLIYRDPRLWTWAFAQRSAAAGTEWRDSPT